MFAFVKIYGIFAAALALGTERKRGKRVLAD